MSSKLQRYERNYAYDAPIHCLFCGQQVLGYETDEGDLTPCPHTLFVSTDVGVEFVADRVAQQLSEKGYTVTRSEGAVEIEPPESDGDRESLEVLSDILQFEDGLVVESYVEAPSFFGTYVGFAPTVDS